MKKIIAILAIPFALHAQQPAEKKAENKSILSELPAAADNPKDEKRKLIESYRQRILKGENFGTLAGLYSEDPGSAQNGGMYKNVQKGSMTEEFEEVASKLKPGEISEVFESRFGFHFMQLMGRKGDTYDVRHILLRFDN